MNRAAMLAEIEGDEGFKAELYLDSENLLTFGIGRCLERKPLTSAEWRRLYDAKQITVSITHEGALSLAAGGMDEVINQLASAVRGWQGLPEEAQHVLINMAFQQGVGGVIAFRNALAAAERHDWKVMAAEMRNSLWYRQTPNRAERLAKRIEVLA